MPQIIPWDEIRNSVNVPIRGKDRIEVRETPGENGILEVVFETVPPVQLWKHVTLTGGPIVDGISKLWIARLELQDEIRGPVSFRVRSEAAANSALFIGPSKVPAEKHLYHVYDFPRNSVRLSLRWLAD